jgi:uncharacterized membrane protein
MFKIISTINSYIGALVATTFLVTSFALAASDTSGQAVLLQDEYTRYKAEVVSVEGQRVAQIPGTNTPHTYQNITVKILNKDKAGQQVQIENDFRMMVPGDTFYLDYTVRTDGEALYIVGEVYRLDAILVLAALFLVLVVWLGGWQGIRSLLALVGSFLAIVYILFPGIIAGYNPVLISGLLAIGVLFFIMYVTHGFNRMTTAAFLGCLVTILITIVLSYLAVLYTKLSGFSSDDAVYLNFNTAGTINFQGLLLGGIIIGVMGIIDDIAITQASIVAELRALKEKLSTQEIFTRAMKIGRDHMGAVVNSLVLAYAGVALPLLLLVYTSNVPLVELLNQEILATELVRTLVGSIGLVLAVPISTILAVLVIKKGDHAHAHGGHSHSH